MTRFGKVSPRALALAKAVVASVAEDGTSTVTDAAVLEPYVHERKVGEAGRRKELAIVAQFTMDGYAALARHVTCTMVPAPRAVFSPTGVAVMREYLRRVEEVRDKTTRSEREMLATARRNYLELARALATAKHARFKLSEVDAAMTQLEQMLEG